MDEGLARWASLSACGGAMPATAMLGSGPGPLAARHRAQTVQHPALETAGGRRSQRAAVGRSGGRPPLQAAAPAAELLLLAAAPAAVLLPDCLPSLLHLLPAAAGKVSPWASAARARAALACATLRRTLCAAAAAAAPSTSRRCALQLGAAVWLAQMLIVAVWCRLVLGEQADLELMCLGPPASHDGRCVASAAEHLRLVRLPRGQDPEV